MSSRPADIARDQSAPERHRCRLGDAGARDRIFHVLEEARRLELGAHIAEGRLRTEIARSRCWSSDPRDRLAARDPRWCLRPSWTRRRSYVPTAASQFVNCVRRQALRCERAVAIAEYRMVWSSRDLPIESPGETC